MNNHPRNAPCYCGSGKKYKNCCLRKDQEANNAQLIKINLPQAGVDDFSEDHALVVNENDQNESVNNCFILFFNCNQHAKLKREKFSGKMRSLVVGS